VKRPFASKRLRNDEVTNQSPQARHDPAADEDAAERAERHRQVGGGAAEHAAEAVQHFQA